MWGGWEEGGRGGAVPNFMSNHSMIEQSATAPGHTPDQHAPQNHAVLALVVAGDLRGSRIADGHPGGAPLRQMAR